MKKIFFILLGMLMLLSSINGATQISDCQQLSTSGIYELTADVLFDTNYCFEITADDVTLDCKGYTIDGESIGYTGVYASGTLSNKINNITINNCNFNAHNYYEIYLEYVTNSKFENIYSYEGSGIEVYNSDYNLFNNVTLEDYGWFYLGNSHYNNITNYTTFYLYNSIYLDSSDYNNVSNANLDSEQGIIIDDSENNFFKNLTFFSYEYDFMLYGCKNNQFIDIDPTGQYPFGYYDSSVNLENQKFSQLFLCNADNSYLNNITIDSENYANGFF